MSRTVNDVEHERLRDPEAVARTILGLCMADSVFASRRAASGLSGLDYLHAITAPSRNAGTMPSFANAASYAAFVLTLPEPPAPAPPFAIVRNADGKMAVVEES